MDWKEYETVTRYIYEALGRETGVKVIGHGANCKIKGKSEVLHQIDVLTSHSDGVHTYKTAIECKYWKELINKETVTKIAHIVEDAGIDKGVVVSKMGFTEDAISTAKYRNIGLVELREFEERDWEGRPRVSHIKSWRLRAEVTGVVIVPSLFDRSEQDNERILPDIMMIKEYNGKETSMMDYVTKFEEELRKQPVNKPIQKRIAIPMSQLINTKTKKVVCIDAIILKGVFSEKPVDLGWKPIDEVWLIMKSIFEDKTFTISKRGLIRVDPPKSS